MDSQQLFVNQIGTLLVQPPFRSVSLQSCPVPVLLLKVSPNHADVPLVTAQLHVQYGRRVMKGQGPGEEVVRLVRSQTTLLLERKGKSVLVIYLSGECRSEVPRQWTSLLDRVNSMI